MAARHSHALSDGLLQTCPGETHVLTGTERMRERPIGVLVDALRTLGADIAYCENEGFPPLRVVGKTLKGGVHYVAGRCPSVALGIPALLMVAPMMREGLTLMLEGEIISRPYIDMTLALMRHFGASRYRSGTHALRRWPLGRIAPTRNLPSKAIVERGIVLVRNGVAEHRPRSTRGTHGTLRIQFAGRQRGAALFRTLGRAHRICCESRPRHTDQKRGGATAQHGNFDTEPAPST